MFGSANSSVPTLLLLLLLLLLLPSLPACSLMGLFLILFLSPTPTPPIFSSPLYLSFYSIHLRSIITEASAWLEKKSHQRWMKVAPCYKLSAVYTAYTLTQLTHTLCDWRRGKTNIGRGSDKNGHEQRERYVFKRNAKKDSQELDGLLDML